MRTAGVTCIVLAWCLFTRDAYAVILRYDFIYAYIKSDQAAD